MEVEVGAEGKAEVAVGSSSCVEDFEVDVVVEEAEVRVEEVFVVVFLVVDFEVCVEEAFIVVFLVVECGAEVVGTLVALAV